MTNVNTTAHHPPQADWFKVFFKLNDFVKLAKDGFSDFFALENGLPVDFKPLADDVKTLFNDFGVPLPAWVNVDVIVAFINGGLAEAQKLKPQ